MGSGSLLWNLTKKYLTVGVIGLTITDRYASIVPVRGGSMSPTFNPRTNTVLGSLGNALLFFFFWKFNDRSGFFFLMLIWDYFDYLF